MSYLIMVIKECLLESHYPIIISIHGKIVFLFICHGLISLNSLTNYYEFSYTDEIQDF